MHQFLPLLLLFAIGATPVYADFEFRLNKPGVIPPGHGGTPPGQAGALSIVATIDPYNHDLHYAWRPADPSIGIISDAPTWGTPFVGDLNGSINVSGGKPPYTYQWDTVAWGFVNWSATTCDYVYAELYDAICNIVLEEPLFAPGPPEYPNLAYVRAQGDLANPALSGLRLNDSALSGTGLYFQVQITVTDSLGAQAISAPIQLVTEAY